MSKQPMTPPELAEKLKSQAPPHLLDVREPEEYAFVALPNAVLIPLDDLALRTHELERWRHQEVVVYCHHGIRSSHAVTQLRELGFTNVHNLSGGIDRWSREVDKKLPKY